MDFSWGNANLFNPKLFVKMQLQQSLSAQTLFRLGRELWGETHPSQPMSSQAVRAPAWLHGNLALSSGTEQGVRWSHGPSPGLLTYQLFWGRGSNTSPSLSLLPPLLPIPPTRKALLLLESTTQRKPETSFLLPVRGKTEKRTDAQQAVTISFPQSPQHSQPQPAARTVAFLSFNQVLQHSSTTKGLQVKGWFSFISEHTGRLALPFCCKEGAVLRCWVVV